MSMRRGIGEMEERGMGDVNSFPGEGHCSMSYMSSEMTSALCARARLTSASRQASGIDLPEGLEKVGTI